MAKIAQVKRKPAPDGRPAAGEAPRRQESDKTVTALDLPAGKLSPAMEAYFDKCLEKIGFVPNVLTPMRSTTPSSKPSWPSTTT